MGVILDQSFNLIVNKRELKIIYIICKLISRLHVNNVISGIKHVWNCLNPLLNSKNAIF